MTDQEFCKIDTAFYGDVVDNISQIRLRSFTGEELKEYVEAAISFTRCCTELCDCAMPDPIDPFAEVDKDTCRKCNCLIA